jgi:hypothetical protein
MVGNKNPMHCISSVSFFTRISFHSVVLNRSLWFLIVVNLCWFEISFHSTVMREEKKLATALICLVI